MYKKKGTELSQGKTLENLINTAALSRHFTNQARFQIKKRYFRPKTSTTPPRKRRISF